MPVLRGPRDGGDEDADPDEERLHPMPQPGMRQDRTCFHRRRIRRPMPGVRSQGLASLPGLQGEGPGRLRPVRGTTPPAGAMPRLRGNGSPALSLLHHPTGRKVPPLPRHGTARVWELQGRTRGRPSLRSLPGPGRPCLLELQWTGSRGLRRLPRHGNDAEDRPADGRVPRDGSLRRVPRSGSGGLRSLQEGSRALSRMREGKGRGDVRRMRPRWIGVLQQLPFRGRPSSGTRGGDPLAAWAQREGRRLDLERPRTRPPPQLPCALPVPAQQSPAPCTGGTPVPRRPPCVLATGCRGGGTQGTQRTPRGASRRHVHAPPGPAREEERQN
jgi:hypothetical protein